MAETVQAVVLYLHLVTASFFVGGSLFVWLVLIPASYRLGSDEARRTELVGTVARRFGRLVTWDFLLLVASGVYSATWYLSSFGELFASPRGLVLLVKVILVALLMVFMFLHDIHFSRRIAALAREGKVEELRLVRRKSRIVSAITLVVMAGILAMAIALQFVG